MLWAIGVAGGAVFGISAGWAIGGLATGRRISIQVLIGLFVGSLALAAWSYFDG